MKGGSKLGQICYLSVLHCVDCRIFLFQDWFFTLEMAVLINFICDLITLFPTVSSAVRSDSRTSFGFVHGNSRAGKLVSKAVAVSILSSNAKYFSFIHTNFDFFFMHSDICVSFVSPFCIF